MYEAVFLQGLRKTKYRKLAQTINSSFCSVDDILSKKISLLGNYLHLVYSCQLGIKDIRTLKALLLILSFTLISTTEED
jgi:hypothetical protein